MEKISEDEIRELKEGMEALGICIVDISSYPATKAVHGKPYMVTIIAGYVSGKACVITADVSGKDITFTVYGQIKESVWEKNGYEYFRKVSRNPVGSESYGQTFHINHYISNISNRGMSARDKIARGITFFKDFLHACGRILEENKFSQHVHVWFVPEYSDEFLQLEKSKGRHCLEVYAHFNVRVKDNFPKDFFVETREI